MSQNPSNEEKSEDAVSFLSGKDASQLDVDLMDKNGDYEYKEPQLMELAGLSVASAIMDAYSNQLLPNHKNQSQPALILCGSGNNGGDGLVAARHLSLFGIYQPVVYYPLLDNPKKEFYTNLLQQCAAFNIKVIKDFPSEDELAKYKLIIDSVFGFSFKAPLRGAWKEQFPIINKVCATHKIPVVAVDVPSGWHIDDGPHENDICLNVDILVSLSAPKHCAKQFKGIHYLGGRFIPQSLCQKYKLKLPPYPGSAQCVRIDSNL
eukprot:59088_1